MCIATGELTTVAGGRNLYGEGIERPLRGDSIPDSSDRQDVKA